MAVKNLVTHGFLGPVGFLVTHGLGNYGGVAPSPPPPPYDPGAGGGGGREDAGRRVSAELLRELATPVRSRETTRPQVGLHPLHPPGPDTQAAERPATRRDETGSLIRAALRGMAIERAEMESILAQAEAALAMQLADDDAVAAILVLAV